MKSALAPECARLKASHKSVSTPSALPWTPRDNDYQVLLHFVFLVGVQLPHLEANESEAARSTPPALRTIIPPAFMSVRALLDLYSFVPTYILGLLSSEKGSIPGESPLRSFSGQEPGSLSSIIRPCCSTVPAGLSGHQSSPSRGEACYSRTIQGTEGNSPVEPELVGVEP